MRELSDAIIQITEAAYDYGAGEDSWLRQVLEAGAPIFDDGLGLGAIAATKSRTPNPQGELDDIHQVQMLGGSTSFIARHCQACRHIDSAVQHRHTKTGLFHVYGHLASLPDQLAIWRREVGLQDAIGIFALDTDGRGIQLLAPLHHIARPGPAERRRFEMIAAHLSAGLRLRSGLTKEASNPSTSNGFPLGAEAVIEPSKLAITDAVEEVRDSKSTGSLRDAAVRIDRARGALRKEDPDTALEAWRALVQGRWSMVDWFDSDGRRYVLALPNQPHVSDPRGLSERESQVVAYAALGESHKMIAYRLGVSRPRVTNALRAAMRKLGVKNQAQLVEKYVTLQGLRPESEPPDS